jgi:Carboxypeptidase regulatory-like domain
MKNDRFQWVFLLALALCFAFAPAARAQAVEIEPNHPCSAAQDLTAASAPLTVTGSIDNPDVDFYRVSAPPGTVLKVNLQGAPSGQGTLADPLLGAFSEDCTTLLLFDDDAGIGLDSFFELPVASGPVVLAATSFADFSFTGFGFFSGSYRLTVEQAEEPARSISGRVVDTETGAPLSNAFVTLTRCAGGFCGEFVGSTFADFQGGFLFENGGFNLSSPLAAGEYQIRIERFNYQVAQVGPFSVSAGQELDLGDLGLTPIPRVGSIRGRLVDAVTGQPLPGSSDPFASLQLLYCDPEPFCFFVRFASAGPDGTFLIEGDELSPLFAGTYKLFAQADQYQATLSEPFQVGDREHFDFGDFGVKSFPVRIYLDQACGPIPASGGSCQLKMRVVNGAPNRFVGETWSIVSGGPIGTPVNFTTFQAGSPKGVSLAPGASAVVPLSFFVPADVSNGAFICVEGFAAQRPHSFNTLGRHFLLCLVKGPFGFSLVPEEHKRDAVRRMKGEPPYPKGRP